MATTPQQVWATGDFSVVGTGIVIVGELLCDSIPVHAGDRVLDVATGSGNTALSAARRGCRVTGVDFVPALLERARERAHAERLKIEFKEGNAEAIPCEDAAFDVVLSTFGSMFAEPTRGAAETLRVCRSGGKIGMANWTPQGMIGEMFRVTASFNPPPAGVQPPSKWGVEEVVRERFGDAVSELKVIPRKVIFRHLTPESWVEFMKTYFGPTIKAHEAAGSRAPELTAAMVEVGRKFNQSGDSTLLALGDYVEVIATKA
ncbi:MAG TPA: class I SAM-dependent methyltransferase [Bryobacteraceae bacterium]|nr:class I SAM-dependent methyltransferase [Bryobacteraceae bacterium]